MQPSLPSVTHESGGTCGHTGWEAGREGPLMLGLLPLAFGFSLQPVPASLPPLQHHSRQQHGLCMVDAPQSQPETVDRFLAKYAWNPLRRNVYALLKPVCARRREPPPHSVLHMLVLARGGAGRQRRVSVGVPRALGQPLTHHHRQGRSVFGVRCRLVHASEALRPWRLGAPPHPTPPHPTCRPRCALGRVHMHVKWQSACEVRSACRAPSGP